MKTSFASKIARLAFAAAILVGSTAAFPASGDGSIAGLSREDALRFAQPSSDITDSKVVDMPVLSGHNYRG